MTVKVCCDLNTFTDVHDIDNDDMAIEDNIPAVFFFIPRRKQVC